jgi:LAO/AO transport system kinase
MEALLLCEAAGYDMGFVETVGVGQSETMVADMVDMFVLLVPPAGGDELQGMKKGIMERVDLVLVNKADGDLRNAAVQAQIEYTSALKLAQSGAWKPRVLCVSSQEKNGLDEVYQTLLEFKEQMISSGELRAKRKNQTRTWMWKEVRETLVQRLMDDTSIQALAVQLEQSVTGGSLAPGVAADQLVDAFLNK